MDRMSELNNVERQWAEAGWVGHTISVMMFVVVWVVSFVDLLQ